MSKILLIHGYCANANLGLIRPAYGADGGFSGFQKYIEAGEATVFHWGKKRDAGILSAYNPWFYRSLYAEERALTKNPETHAVLRETLMREKPEIIVCHSLGAELLWQFLCTNPLPPFVRTIHFLQADLQRNEQLPQENVGMRLREGSLTWYNVAYRFDPTLWISAIFHRSLRAGLFGMKTAGIKNKWYEPKKSRNPHMEPIRDAAFADRILAMK